MLRFTLKRNAILTFGFTEFKVYELNCEIEVFNTDDSKPNCKITIAVLNPLIKETFENFDEARLIATMNGIVDEHGELPVISFKTLNSISNKLHRLFPVNEETAEKLITNELKKLDMSMGL